MSPNRVYPVDHPDAQPASSHHLSVAAACEHLDLACERCGAGKIGPEVLCETCGFPVPHLKFHGDALRNLLGQEGAHGVAVVKDVLFAVDAQGQILNGPQHFALEDGQPCPPLC